MTLFAIQGSSISDEEFFSQIQITRAIHAQKKRVNDERVRFFDYSPGEQMESLIPQKDFFTRNRDERAELEAMEKFQAAVSKQKVRDLSDDELEPESIAMPQFDFEEPESDRLMPIKRWLSPRIERAKEMLETPKEVLKIVWP